MSVEPICTCDYLYSSAGFQNMKLNLAVAGMKGDFVVMWPPLQVKILSLAMPSHTSNNASKMTKRWI